VKSETLGKKKKIIQMNTFIH